eukprot:9165776-Pyramimonas_sp.AAC.1
MLGQGEPKAGPRAPPTARQEQGREKDEDVEKEKRPTERRRGRMKRGRVRGGRWRGRRRCFDGLVVVRKAWAI